MQRPRQSLLSVCRRPANQVLGQRPRERPRVLQRLSAVGGKQRRLAVAGAVVVIQGLDDDGVEIGNVAEGQVVRDRKRQLQKMQVDGSHVMPFPPPVPAPRL